jgi:hypothetical protein
MRRGADPDYSPPRGIVRRIAAAAIVAIAFVLASGQALAEDGVLLEAQDRPAPDSASPPQDGRGTVIQGEVVEAHDLLSDANDPSSPLRRGIEWSHSFTVTLSGKNHVEETWRNTRLGVEGRSFLFGKHGNGPKRGLLTTRVENNATIGDSASRVVWHVLGQKKLQRIFPGQHFLMIMNIEIGESNACRVEVKYLRQTGFVSVVMKRADTGEMANFSLPRVERASCAIQ